MLSSRVGWGSLTHALEVVGFVCVYLAPCLLSFYTIPLFNS